MTATGGTPPQGDGWRLRPYRAGDERWIIKQFERVFGRRVSEESWRWKLAQPSPAFENVWLAVDAEDRPIFQYAAVPRRLRLPTGTVDALVLVDLWTAPEYRGRGIFTSSARWVHDYWRRSGVCGVLSPFNARDEPRYQRLGWRYLFPLRWQIRPLRPEAILGRRLGVTGLQRQRWLGSGWNRLWDRWSKPRAEVEVNESSVLESAVRETPRTGGARFSLEHDQEWVQRRYLSCPHRDYSVLTARHVDGRTGHLAYWIDDSQGRRFAFIAELVADGPAIESALIDSAIALFTKRSAVAIATLATPRTDLYRAWRRRGFLFSWGRFCVHWLPLADEPPLAQLREPRAWELAGGDFDII